MHNRIEEYIEQLIPTFLGMGVSLADQKEIEYGYQLVLTQLDQVCTMALYHSEKKGLSVVLGGKKTTRLYQEMEDLISTNPPSGSTSNLPFHNWGSWIGSDESGKGDYLGCLVVCAFHVDNTISRDLIKIGVRDSKLNNNERNTEIASNLMSRYPERIACIVLKPLKYNEIYEAMAKEKKNLNDLLAWQHKQAIIQLSDRINNLDGILVDQFSKSMKTKKLISRSKLTCPVVERPHAESDLAVASASIIARYSFLAMQKKMSDHYKLEFPFGANRNAEKAAGKFIQKYGVTRLNEVAKLNFRTTAKVMQTELELNNT